MASAILPSNNTLHSSFRFPRTSFTVNMSKFIGRRGSYHKNLEVSEESSDDDDDCDYSAAMAESRKPMRQIPVKYAPQAVVDWYTIALDKKTALKKRVVKEDALGHLLAMGWYFFYTQKKTKQELRYRSPTGKIYISLRTACKACIDQGDAAAMPPPPAVVVPPPPPVVVLPPPPPPPAAVSDYSQPEKKDSPPPGWERREETPEPKANDSERVESPAPLPERNWGKQIAAPPAAARGTSRNRRTGLSYLIDHGVVSPGVRVYYSLGGKADPLMAWGLITDKGVIKCDCCSKEFTISNFEAHTGSTKRRPAANIFLEDGRSLLDCQKQIPNQNQNQISTETKKVNNNNNAQRSDSPCLDKNDCICSICHFGGELILCDLCPAAFHGSCLGFKGIPIGDWFCPCCCCKICGQVSYDFDAISSSDATFVKCIQCEQYVHSGCVKSVQVLQDGSHQTINRENWFCTKRCEDVHMGLQSLLWKPIPVSENQSSLTFTLMKHSSSNTLPEYQRKKFNSALGVMHESFRPVKDPITKKDLIEDVLFSRKSKLKRLNFEGFYTVILERKSTVTTVATVRVFGEEVAEVPFVATRLKYRRNGMCRSLMKELENQLMKLGVKRLTLPAVPETLNTWTEGFGFTNMTDSDRLEFVKYAFLGFQHTVRCLKDLELRIPNNLVWGPRKRLKQSVSQDEIITDSISFDDWSSFSDAFD